MPNPMEQWIPLVNRIAVALHRRLPRHVCRDDLVGYGCLGLADAIRTFDPARGVKFSSYAGPRIHGAMIDGLRQEDWAPRRARQRGDVPQVLSISTVLHDGESDRAPITVEMNLIDRKEMRRREVKLNADLVETLLNRLRPKDAEVVRRHWIEGQTMQEVAREMGVTSSRVHQRQSHALARMGELAAKMR